MPEQRCAICGKYSRKIASTLGVCRDCIFRYPERARAIAERAHRESRRLFGLPETPPQTPGGILCGLCVHQCRIGEGERGFCGLRTVRDGKFIHLAGTPQRGVLHWYRDPLPTNCVADWVCAGHERRGYHNLAVFYASCTCDCLYCQNWHYREIDPKTSAGISAQELAMAANRRTFCVCYFGGDPASQMPHALASAHLLAERGVVVCWETSGTAHPRLMDRAVELSLRTGGTVKFDLKAFDDRLHYALTGASNSQTLENFARAASRFGEHPSPPLVVASTLLVPGYVDADEVSRIARFIAGINPDIPYALLAFAPNYLMPDLPTTSVALAEAALEAAREAGLRNVRIGNRHLLSWDE
ncbi:MAG TPA: radical SAM protein [Caldilineae bacterium]|nr:radical SAM protein [Caldilineae bacterium]